MKTLKLSKRKICKGIKQIGGEVIVFDDYKGFSLETFCTDYIFVILKLFKNVKEVYKRLKASDGYMETYLNYYPEEKKVVIEVLDAHGESDVEEIEVTGKGRDFLIQEITNWCKDYEQCTPEELLRIEEQLDWKDEVERVCCHLEREESDIAFIHITDITEQLCYGLVDREKIDSWTEKHNNRWILELDSFYNLDSGNIEYNGIFITDFEHGTMSDTELNIIPEVKKALDEEVKKFYKNYKKHLT